MLVNNTRVGFRVFFKKSFFFVKFFLGGILMQKFTSVESLINQLKPDKPVYCIRKKSILSASNFFQKKFPGKILYAVKTNPHPEVIKTLLKSGISEFDVASISEIKSVRKFSQSAKCSFMHTVKSREDVQEAYFKYGVKAFSLDADLDLSHTKPPSPSVPVNGPNDSPSGLPPAVIVFGVTVADE